MFFKQRSKSLVGAAHKPRRKDTSSRSSSVPPSFPNKATRVKSILKFKSLDDSLHSTYGESKDGYESPSSVTFKDIMIREYARTVGDNPSCTSGPPISISWEYDPNATVIPLEEYEKLRPERRTHFQMVLPRAVRQQMLRNEWQVTQAQIAAAVRANIKIKNQRRATFNNLDKATKVEEMMENAGKKLVRGLSLKKSTDKQVAELEEQMKQVYASRQQHQLERMIVANEDLVTEEDDDASVDVAQRRSASFSSAAKIGSTPPVLEDEPFEVEA